MTVFASKHPLVKHKVSLLRDQQISVKSFRELTKELAALLTMEATYNLAIQDQPLTCWSGEISAPMLSDKQPTLVPILRAGLGMLDGALSILPCAKVSVVGLKRNEESAHINPVSGKVEITIESYYQNLVPDIAKRKAIVIDPMLATGGSAVACINLLKESGCKDITALFLVAAPEGIEALNSSHPDINIYVASVDEKLNEQGYILPGLGDAGDKIFGTTVIE